MKDEDKDSFMGLWDGLPEDVQKELLKAVEESSATSAEEFVNEIMIGECPRCGCTATTDCENVKDVEDMTVGLCRDCGYLWCSECGRPVERGAECIHWMICEACPREKDEFEDCGIPPWECEKIMASKDEETEETFRTCAWCSGSIAPDEEVFAIGVKARKGMKLKKYEGTILSLGLTHEERSIPAIVVRHGSEAKKEGLDLLIMVCSEKCGELLKKALRKEKLTVVQGFKVSPAEGGSPEG